MFANVVLYCALAFWAGVGLLWLGRSISRICKRGLLREHGIGTRIVMAAFAMAALYVGGSKAPSGRVTIADDYIQDAGSYLTNDVAHVAISKKTSILPDDTEILVYARELSKSNSTDWVRLSPYLTFADHPYDYTLVNATNYNVMVAASYTPAPTVHTNGVWTLKGFCIPGFDNRYSFGNTKIYRAANADTLAYIQDGLVFHFDGIENAGRGVHDPDAEDWANLVNRNYDGIGTGIGGWTDNCYTNISSGFPFYVGGLLSDVFDTRVYTVEMLVYTTARTSRQTILGNYTGDSDCLNLEINAGGRTDGSSRYYSGGNPDIHCGSVFTSNGVPHSVVWAVDCNVPAQRCYIDGVLKASWERSMKTTSSGSKTTVMAGERSRNSMSLKGGLHSIRIYSRVLDADEISANYEIDKWRFNLE